MEDSAARQRSNSSGWLRSWWHTAGFFVTWTRLSRLHPLDLQVGNLRCGRLDVSEYVAVHAVLLHASTRKHLPNLCATHGSGRLELLVPDMSDVIMTLVFTSDEGLQDIYGHFVWSYLGNATRQGKQKRTHDKVKHHSGERLVNEFLKNDRSARIKLEIETIQDSCDAPSYVCCRARLGPYLLLISLDLCCAESRPQNTLFGTKTGNYFEPQMAHPYRFSSKWLIRYFLLSVWWWLALMLLFSQCTMMLIG